MYEKTQRHTCLKQTRSQILYFLEKSGKEWGVKRPSSENEFLVLVAVKMTYMIFLNLKVSFHISTNLIKEKQKPPPNPPTYPHTLVQCEKWTLRCLISGPLFWKWWRICGNTVSVEHHTSLLLQNQYCVLKILCQGACFSKFNRLSWVGKLQPTLAPTLTQCKYTLCTRTAKQRYTVWICEIPQSIIQYYIEYFSEEFHFWVVFKLFFFVCFFLVIGWHSCLYFLTILKIILDQVQHRN